MRCPICRCDNDRVVDSRASTDGFAIRRRRECLSCNHRYTTYERLEERLIKVVKRNNAREPFSREKMRTGIAKACWKRPLNDEQIDALITELENEACALIDGEITTEQLGQMVMERLRQIDQVAFVRFASVYRRFEDVRDFVDELRPMLQRDQED